MEFVDKIQEIFDITEKYGTYDIKISAKNNPLIDEEIMSRLNDGIDLYVEYLKSGVAQNLDAVKKMEHKLLHFYKVY